MRIVGTIALWALVSVGLGRPALAADDPKASHEAHTRLSNQIARWVRGVVFRPQRIGRATVGTFFGQRHLLDPITFKPIKRLKGDVRAEGPMLVVRGWHRKALLTYDRALDPSGRELHRTDATLRYLESANLLISPSFATKGLDPLTAEPVLFDITWASENHFWAQPSPLAPYHLYDARHTVKLAQGKTRPSVAIGEVFSRLKRGDDGRYLALGGDDFLTTKHRGSGKIGGYAYRFNETTGKLEPDHALSRRSEVFKRGPSLKEIESELDDAIDETVDGELTGLRTEQIERRISGRDTWEVRYDTPEAAGRATFRMSDSGHWHIAEGTLIDRAAGATHEVPLM
jgi:hypothetical protein